MTRRVVTIVAGVVVALALIIGGASLWLFSGPHEIVVSQETAQSVVNPKLPFTTKNGITVSKAILDFTGAQPKVNFELSVTEFGVVYTLDADASGKVRYDVNCACFYVRPTELHVHDVKANDTTIGSKVLGFAERHMDPDKLDARKAALKAKADDLLQRVVRVASDEIFEHIPVYTFPNNKKGNAARVVLKDVQIHDSKLHLIIGGN